MTVDPRAALAQLVTALERHLEVASSRRDPDDPAVVSAAEALATAFDDYDEALFVATDVATPLAVYGDLDDDVEPEDADASGVYAGLDDEDIDFDDSDDDDDDDDDEDDDDGAADEEDGEDDDEDGEDRHR